MVERVEDELVAAWLGVAESTVERECRERDLLQKKKKNWGGGWFFVNFGLNVFPLPGHQRLGLNVFPLPGHQRRLYL